jgi:hypothetical protein
VVPIPIPASKWPSGIELFAKQGLRVSFEMRRPGNGGAPCVAKAGIGGHAGGDIETLTKRMMAFSDLRPHVRT